MRFRSFNFFNLLSAVSVLLTASMLFAAGAPANNSLPNDNKADAQYPVKFFLPNQSPVRNQGHRGDCTIFASTALTMRDGSQPTSTAVPASTASGRSVLSRITSTGFPSEGPSS